jgi:hypothetical protein
MHYPMKATITALILFASTCLADTDALDSSALPTTVTSSLIYSETVNDLVHDTLVFKSGETVLMTRDIWLTIDRKTIDRVSHVFYFEKQHFMVIYDFPENEKQPEMHTSIQHSLPEETRLLTSQPDSISPGEWRFTREQKVLLSFVRDKDGLIRPWTHAEFEANQRHREAKLSRE